MANNYLQFSTVLKLEDEYRDWWDKRLETLEDPEFTYAWEAQGIWLYAEECGNPDSVAELIQQFFKERCPGRKHAFTWATTCSKMREDEFSGGGVSITADKLTWLIADDVHKL